MTDDVWTYFITRDSLNGTLSAFGRLWWVKPKRLSNNGRVWWLPGNTVEGGVLGMFDIEELKTCFKTVPETDLEMIVVSQGVTAKMRKNRK